MTPFFNTSIHFLKGVGEQKAEIFKKELSIFTYWDLINYFPFRYVDRSKVFSIAELSQDLPYIQIIGEIVSIDILGENFSKRLVLKVKDQSGTMEMVWFKGINWVIEKLKLHQKWIFFGKPNYFNKSFSIVHPEIDPIDKLALGSALHPVYPLTEKLKNRKIESKQIRDMVFQIINHSQFKIDDIWTESIKKQYELLDLKSAYQQIHFPKNNTLLIQANQRLKFDELMKLNLKILLSKVHSKHKNKGYFFHKIGSHFNEFYHQKLPFPLTNAQKNVIKEIRQDMISGFQMNRLLQGDVGSGKTVVALLCMLIAIDNQTQATLMAPTEILANQHYENISSLTEGLGLKIVLLTGSTKSKEKKQIYELIKAEQIDILIGTHALIEKDALLTKPGIVIIDEQHRFGVAQRAKLFSKYTIKPHVLVMTATPIPRTLAMTVYGDLDISKIDELPIGRKPIKTIHRFEYKKDEIYDFIKSEINKGRQAYIVYPLIEESETLDYQNLIEGYGILKSIFKEPTYQMGMVHGKMSNKDKDLIMDGFKKGHIHILVSTTVIEVGVNVPNATIMMIENSEKFGLTQLHQLRGRVGRGHDQSYCILMSSHKIGATAKERLTALCQTNDGFEIANLDLKLRGPGDIAGTKQSGLLELKIADLIKDESMLLKTREIAADILQHDPLLEKPEHLRLKQVLKQDQNHKDWSKIA